MDRVYKIPFVSRIAEDYRKEMERINKQRTQEHEKIKERHEAKLKNIREETKRDEEEMERNKKERIKFYEVWTDKMMVDKRA